MKDRFKFRCWHKPTKIMYEVYEFNKDYVKATPSFTHKNIWLQKTEDCILMQCTGLKDNSGKLIYESDIVKFSSIYGHAFFEIKWNNEFATFGYKDIDDTDFSEFGSLYQDAQYVEILGNIYENPELLKDGEQ